MEIKERDGKFRIKKMNTRIFFIRTEHFKVRLTKSFERDKSMAML